MFSVVSPAVWVITLIAWVAIIVLDLTVVSRRQQAVSTKGALCWVFFYVGLAGVFGIGLWVFLTPTAGQQFLAGYLTEYSLSADNLFVFMLIMSRFAVPRLAEDKVLSIGIVLSLVFRAAFVLAGSAAITAWSWALYVLGAILAYTAIRLVFSSTDEEPEVADDRLVRWLRRILPLGHDYEGRRLVTRVAGRRMGTPLVIVIVAIGIANTVFALDSIPAIFGLTSDAYIILAANALALMGLRQLYFLIGGLVERVAYFSKGLAVILGFISVKLIIEALHQSTYDRVGSLHLPEIGTITSLFVIVATLGITTALSLIKTRRETESSFLTRRTATNQRKVGHPRVG